MALLLKYNSLLNPEYLMVLTFAICFKITNSIIMVAHNIPAALKPQYCCCKLMHYVAFNLYK